MVYAYDWPEPRYGPQAFTIMLTETFKAHYGYEMKTYTMGKPHEFQYEFTARQLAKNAEK